MPDDAVVVDEHERKYVGVADLDIAGAGLSAGASVQPSEPQRLDATYFDTADLRLLRSGITLRRRRGGSDAGWQIKFPSGTDTRTEVRFAVTNESEIPDQMLQLLHAVLRGSALVVATRITTLRQRRNAFGDNGDLLAEIETDEVAAQNSSGRSTSWREYEVEWTPSGQSFADRLDALFLASGATRADYGSKPERALSEELSSHGEPPRKLRHRRCTEMLLANYLDAQIAAITAADLGFRYGRGDAVHRIRVAARRARSAVEAYPNCCPRKHRKSLCDELRWLAGELGEIRDLEVQRDRLTARLANQPSEVVEGPIADRIDESFRVKTSLARSRAMNVLASERYLRILDELTALISRLRTGESHHRARTDASGALKRLSRKAAHEIDALKTAGKSSRDTAAHRSRKTIKHLRYATEVAYPLNPRAMEIVLRRFDKLQDTMGEYQDSVVAKRTLSALRDEALKAKEPVRTYRKLIGEESEVQKANLQKFRGRFHDLLRSMPDL